MHRLLPVLVTWLLPIAAIASAARPVAAQTADLTTGTRVRVVTLDGQTIVGSVVAVRDDTLSVRPVPQRVPKWMAAPPEPPGEIGLPLASLRRLQVSDGLRARPGRGAGIGFLVGATLVGGLMYVLCASADDCPRTVVPLAFGAGGGVLGAGLGALIGSQRQEQWRTLPGVGAAPAGARE